MFSTNVAVLEARPTSSHLKFVKLSPPFSYVKLVYLGYKSWLVPNKSVICSKSWTDLLRVLSLYLLSKTLTHLRLETNHHCKSFFVLTHRLSFILLYTYLYSSTSSPQSSIILNGLSMRTNHGCNLSFVPTHPLPSHPLNKNVEFIT